MIRTTDKGPEIYKQKLYQLGIEPKIIDHYTALYEQEQHLEDVIKVGNKIMKTKKGPEVKVKQKVSQALMQKASHLRRFRLRCLSSTFPKMKRH